MPKKRSTRNENAERDWPQLNPSLKDLEVLIGEWDAEISQASFLPSLSDTVKAGHAYFEWAEHGGIVRMREGGIPTEFPTAVWLIGRDGSSQEYEIFHYDTRGVSRIYRMSMEGRLWKIWRNAPDFSQRYEGTISDDRNTIRARWEKSADGKQWEHDFNITYIRTRSGD